MYKILLSFIPSLVFSLCFLNPAWSTFENGQVPSDTHVSFAGFLPELFVPYDLNKVEENGVDQESWISPNEYFPEALKWVLKEAPNGLVISVGSERGFIDLALAKNVTHLLLTDNNRAVVLFNSINIALLKLAENQASYLYLRLDATIENWREKVHHSINLDDESKRLLTDKRSFDFWIKMVRKCKKLGFYALHQWHHKRPLPPLRPYIQTYFKNSNYLQNNNLFNRLSSLAKRNRIQAVHIDFSEEKLLDLVQLLEFKKIRLSVIDVSNAWWPKYFGLKRLGEIIGDFFTLAENKSIVVVTNTIPGMAGPGVNSEFGYITATFENLNIQDRASFLRYLGKARKKLHEIDHTTIPVISVHSATKFNPHKSWVNLGW